MMPDGIEHYLTEEGEFKEYEPNIIHPWLNSIPLTLEPSTVLDVSAFSSVVIILTLFDAIS